MVEVYIDGASAGNPGPSGAGIFIKDNGNILTFSIPLGVMSNHEAEFHALIKALEICLQNKFSLISVRTDSQLVENAVEKNHIKNKTFLPLLETAIQLISKFDLFFIKWISSQQNKNADELARKAIHLNT